MKAKELRELTIAELQRKELETRQELLRTRIQAANQQLKNPLKLRHLRRTIARIMTIIGQKGPGKKQLREEK